MGHSRASKQQTHERIVQIAAQRFRELGIDGLSIANLMKEAGLTHGGFYKHFESRDELVTEAVACALASSASSPHARQVDSYATLVAAYLSEGHRNSPGDGCALGALANDMGRAPDEARARYTEQLRGTIAGTAGRLPDSGDAARAQAIVTISAMVGALGLARAVDDPALSDEIMAVVREHLVAQFAPTQVESQ